jgi:hypothetical protein
MRTDRHDRRGLSSGMDQSSRPSVADGLERITHVAADRSRELVRRDTSTPAMAEQLQADAKAVLTQRIQSENSAEPPDDVDDEAHWAAYAAALQHLQQIHDDTLQMMLLLERQLRQPDAN